MAKSVPEFESDWELVAILENSNPKRALANINNQKTICQEEWYKRPTNYLLQEIENY